MNQMKAGALLSYVSMALGIIVTLVYTPIMIRQLSQSEYGLFVLVGAIAAYFNILDLGLGNTIVRYISRNRELGNKDGEAKLNGTFFRIYLCIGLISGLIGFILFNNVNEIFSNALTSEEISKIKVIVTILTFNFMVTFPMSVFGAYIQSYERFIVNKSVNIFRILAVPILTTPFLLMGYGAITMIVVISAVNIMCLTFNLYYATAKLGMQFSSKTIDKSLLKEMLGYSFFVFIAVIADQLYWNTDQFVVGILAGTLPVAIYGIAMQFKAMYMQFSTAISGLFLPKTSRLVANNASIDRLSNEMIKYGRVQYYILGMVLTGFALFGKTFINLWAGPGYSLAYYIALIVMIPLTIPLIQNFGISILYAKNLQKFRSLVLVVIAVFNLIITIPLVKEFGVMGAAIGTAISLFIGNIVLMNFYYYFKLKLNIPLFWSNILKISLPILASFIIGIVLNVTIDREDLISFLFKVLTYITIYLLLIIFFAFNDQEHKILKQMAIKIKSLISI